MCDRKLSYTSVMCKHGRDLKSFVLKCSREHRESRKRENCYKIRMKLRRNSEQSKSENCKKPSVLAQILNFPSKDTFIIQK